MRPGMHTHEGVIDEANPACRYKVTDERGRKGAFITNGRAPGRLASWEISRVDGAGHVIETVGDHRTAEDALASLQQGLNP